MDAGAATHSRFRFGSIAYENDPGSSLVIVSNYYVSQHNLIHSGALIDVCIRSVSLMFTTSHTLLPEIDTL